MEDYNKWNIEDFVDDESFNNFVLNGRSYDVEKWDLIIKQNPQIKPLADKARQVVLLLSRAQKTHNKDIESRLQRFLLRISFAEQRGLRSIGVPYIQVRKAFLYAAAVLLMITIGLNVDFYIKSLDSGNDGLCMTIVGKGQKSEVVLPDGTKVWLNSESQLTYPANFGEKNRNVSLVGEGYFNVAHDARHPFLVSVSDIRFKVYGTEFNLKCYKNEDIVEATLINGSMSIQQKGGSEVFLKPSQKFICRKDGVDISDKVVKAERSRDSMEELKRIKHGTLLENVDTYPVTAWKEHKLVFEDETFADLAVKIERWYDVKVVIESEKIRQYRYRGSFENETIEQAIQALTLATPFNYRFDKRTIYIKE